MIALLFLPLPGTSDGMLLFVVVDEATGMHLHEQVKEGAAVKTQDAVWERLAAQLGDLIANALPKSQKPYTGLRGTTVLGSMTLPDGRLQLRSRTDVMAFDHELAIVARKALASYLDSPI